MVDLMESTLTEKFIGALLALGLAGAIGTPLIKSMMKTNEEHRVDCVSVCKPLEGHVDYQTRGSQKCYCLEGAELKLRKIY